MNLGMPEMIFIFLLALIIFGPRKLPEVGRQLGKALSEFKRASNDFKAQLEDEIRQIETLEEQKKTIHAVEAPAPSALPAPEGTVPYDSYASSAAAHAIGESPTPSDGEPLTSSQSNNG